MKNIVLYWRKKRLSFDFYSLWIGLLLLSACVIRVVLIALSWPTANSDEGTMGLMALHIAYQGDHPVFLYGNSYLGSLESYIGAALFWMLGPTLFALRLGLVCIDILFFYAMYRLSRLLYTRGMALFVVFLLCFGSTETLVRQLKVVGGTMEAMLFSSLALLIATWLALTCQKSIPVGIDSSRPSGPIDPVSTDVINRSLRGSGSHEEHQKNTVHMPTQRLLLYACCGLVIGLAMWSHMLLLPFIGAALLLLLLFCRSEMRRRVWLSLLVGFLIGFLPTILFDIQHPLENALFTLVLQQSSGGAATLPHTFWDQILGTVLISIPMATGFNTACNLSADADVWRSQLSPCLVPQGIWGVCYLIVMSIAVVFAARELRRCYLIYRKSQGEDERRALVYTVARALLVVCGSLTLLAYLRSPAPALVPLTSARYLVGLTVILPTLIAPFWSALRRGLNLLRPGIQIRPDIQTSRSLLQRRGLALTSSLVLLLIVVNYAISLVTVFQQIPSVHATNRQQAMMVNDLLHAHIVHFYSDYWTCNRVIFQSDERLICSVLDNQLQVGQNRYPPYQQIVQSDPNASYVFVVGSPQATAFAQRASQSRETYSVMQMDGYVVYRPTS